MRSWILQQHGKKRFYQIRHKIGAYTKNNDSYLLHQIASGWDVLQLIGTVQNLTVYSQLLDHRGNKIKIIVWE